MMSLESIKRVILYMTAVVTGIMLCTVLLSLCIKSVDFNDTFQKQLFLRNDIYGHVQSIVDSSMSSFTANMGKASQDNYSKSKEILDMIKGVVSKDVIKKNVDVLREGLFEYFRGEKQLLPDMYLPNSTLSSQGTTENMGKVNLNAVLGILNRQDISNSLSFLRFIYFIIRNLPGIALIIIVLMTFTGVLVCKKSSELLKWIKSVFAVCGFSCLFILIAFVVLNFLIIPSRLSALTLSLPLPRETVFSYITGCIMSTAVFMLTFAVANLLLSAKAYNIYSFCSKTKLFKVIEKRIERSTVSNSFKIITYVFLGVLTIGLSISNITNTRNEFTKNNFAEVLSKIRNVSTSTKVIAAVNDSIYTLQIELKDKETEIPLENVKLIVSGKNSAGATYNSSSRTDIEGHAKFTTDKGDYFLSFDSTDFPKHYKIPSPIYFELNEAGTTIITIMLEPQSEDTTHEPVPIS